MRKTFWKDALRNIKRRIVSWFSVVTIVFIGTSVILGLYFAYASLSGVGSDYIREHNLKDMDLACSMGVKKEDIGEILKLEGVKDAEGYLSVSGFLSSGDKNAGATLMSLTERVSKPYVLEGTLPNAENECALNRELAEKLGVSVGDEITVRVSSARFEDVLNHNDFQVVGVVGHPDYMVPNKVDYCILPMEAFDMSQSRLDYTNVAVDVDMPENFGYAGKQYDARLKAVKSKVDLRLTELAGERTKMLAQELDTEYDEAKQDAEKQLADGKTKIDDAQKEFDEKIAEAEKQLADAKNELEEGKRQAKEELEAGEKKIQEGEKEYRTKISDGEKQLAKAEEDLENELARGRELLDAGRSEIERNERLLNEKDKEYQNGVAKYQSGMEQLEEGKRKYQEGVDTLEKYLPRKLNDDWLPKVDEFLNEVEAPGKEKIMGILNAVASESPLDRALGFREVYYLLNENVRGKFEDLVLSFGLDLRQHLEGLTTLANARIEIAESTQKLEEAKAELNDARRQLDDGWRALGQGKKTLEEGEAEYVRKEQEARSQLTDAKAEFERLKKEGAKQLQDAKKLFSEKKEEADSLIAEHEKELADGQKEYQERKEEGERELAKARKDYEQAKADAESELSDAQEQIADAKALPCDWFVQTRDANLYFMEYESNCDVVWKVFIVFTPIYAFVIIVVCFFTMAIIVEEQSKQIGMCKAFGMYKPEIRNKYLIFGATGAFLGAILGICAAFFIEKVVTNGMGGLFVFGDIPHKFQLLPFILMPIGAVAVTMLAVFWSSEKVLSCSAVGLISGNEPAKRGRKTAAKGRSRGVYFSLIVNNFLMDAGRETVSTFIILVCCFLIGLGMTVKLGHSGAMHHQVEDIFLYDLSLTLSDDISETERNEVLDALENYDYVSFCKFGAILQTDDGQTLTEVNVVDDIERFRRFYQLMDEKGNPIAFSDDGVFATFEMKEKNGLHVGRDVKLITTDLQMISLKIKGNFLLHVGKSIFLSYDHYRETFGEEPHTNTYLLKIGEDDPKATMEKLSKIAGVSDVSAADELLVQKASVIKLYSIVVLVVISFAIMLSFMILLNLSNILVAHRMRELLTMRVNGFSNAQVIGYLVREIFATTSLGLGLGLLIGVPAAYGIIRNVESNGFMFLRKTYPAAWILSVACNVVFALVINSVAFQKIKKVPLTDITKY